MIKKLETNHLEISNSLLEFLTPEEERKLTKLEAYHDLLQMATHYKSHVCCFGQEFDLMPGEIVTSISELAKKWRWQRATVRKFVDSLVELGQVIHTPQVKCSRMELVSLRFKWLPADRPACLLSSPVFPNVMLTRDELGHRITSVLNVLSEQFADNASPLTDSEGNIIYTSEQRCQVANIYVEAMMMAFRHLVVNAYTCDAEKSLLDTFFKICKGSEDDAARIMDAIFLDEGHDINLMIWETVGDTRDAVTRILSHVFRGLSERLPVDFTPTDSKDKASETDGESSQGKCKEHTGNSI